MPPRGLMRYEHLFPSVIPLSGTDCSRVTHPSATRITNLPAEAFRSVIPVRLACVKHAASVRPEPGSNSDVQSFSTPQPLLASARQSLRFLPASWRFTHRILTVSQDLPAPLAASSAPRPALPHRPDPRSSAASLSSLCIVFKVRPPPF